MVEGVDKLTDEEIQSFNTAKVKVMNLLKGGFILTGLIYVIAGCLLYNQLHVLSSQIETLKEANASLNVRSGLLKATGTFSPETDKGATLLFEKFKVSKLKEPVINSGKVTTTLNLNFTEAIKLKKITQNSSEIVSTNVSTHSDR